MLYVLLCAQLPAQDLPTDNIWIDLEEQVRCRAVGNGQATGQIGTLFLSNESEQAFMIQAQAFFIPSDGRHQGYLARIPAGLTAAPQSVTSIPVIGYCTDLDKPAVPASSPLPPPNQWYAVAQKGVGTSGLKILAQDAELEAFEPTQIPELEASKAFRRERSKADWQLQYPKSNEALEGSLQIDEYANISAPLLRAILQQLEERYDLLEQQNLIRTPLSGDPLRERETIIQHSLWIAIARLRGAPYNYTDFEALTEVALEELGTSNIGEAEREAAIKTLWSTFHRLLYQAQLSSQLPADVAQFRVLVNLPDWQQLNLTAAYRKPALLAPNSSAAASPKKRALWLPIGGGIALGSGLTYILLQDEPTIPGDTVVVPPPPPPPPPLPDTLVVMDDAYTLACLPPTTLSPLDNDSGTQPQITGLGDTGNATVSIMNNEQLLITDFGGQTAFSFTINITDSLGVTKTSTVSITVNTPDIAATDDSFSTDYATPLSANVLSNDSGESLTVVDHSPPLSGATVSLSTVGDLMVTPAPDFTGTLNMTYIIEDACLQQDTATVTVNVGAPDCTFSLELNSIDTDCGLDNGSIEANTEAGSDYDYLWSTGAVSASINDLPAGNYSLTVTSNEGLCEEVFNATVAENPIEYITSIEASPGNCVGGGDISMELTAPENGNLIVNWDGPAGSNSLNTPPGTLHLGAQFNLLPGMYSFTVYPEAAGETCAEFTQVTIADTTLALQAVADSYSTAYETSLNGNVLLNDSGQNISLSANTTPASGTLTISGEGQFTYTPADNFTGTVSFEYTLTDECGNSTNTTVNIEVGAPNCDITLSLQPAATDCGLSNGTISTSIQPTDEYTYNWSTGATSAGISDLNTGTYSLTVSSEGGLCEESGEAIITQNPINYIVSSSTTPGTCLGDGNIRLVLQSPEDLPLSLAITANGETTIFSLMPGVVDLSTLMNLPAGTYPIQVYPTAAGTDCSETQTITIPEDTPSINTINDAYSIAFQNLVNDNMLTNDEGLQLQVTGVSDIVGGVVNFQPNGDFLYVPFNDFTGTGSFNYAVADACGNTSTASVTVEVGEPDCTFTVMFSMEAAECGLPTGSLLATPSPDDVYTFQWSTGATSPQINMVEAGSYQLTVTNNEGLCSQVFTSLVSELPANYIQSSSSSPGNCLGGGDITLVLSSPDNSNFGGVIVGPSLNQTLNLTPGVHNLGESYNLVPGMYTVTIYSLTAGFSCSQSIEIEIPDNSPSISVINDAFSTAYETALTANFMSNDSGLQLAVTEVSSVNNGTLDTDAAGNFTFTPAAGFAGITGFTYTLTDACGQTASGEVIITVSPPPCDFTVELAPANAVCNLPNGSIQAVVSPAGTYTYAWSTGSTENNISDLPTGTYNVTVTGNNGFCTQEASATISNGPPVFIDSLSTAPGNCAGDGSIIIEAYAPGNGTLDVLINGPNGSDLITVNSGFSDLGDLVNLPSGVYDIVIYPTNVGLSCSEETFAIVEDNTEPFVVNDDNYFTPFQTPLVRNVLTNDEGLLLEIVSIDNISGGTVEMGTNGDFVFTPETGATGMASFTYTAMDACTDLAEGLVTIEIGPSTCNHTVNLSIDDASCGFADGSITALVNPPGDYSYLWSNDSTTQSITNLPAGIYSVTVTDNSDDCPLLVRDTIMENAPTYSSNLLIVPENCMGSAQIEFELSASYPGVYTVEVSPEDGPVQTLQNISPGLVRLQDFIVLEAGTYSIAVFNQNIGVACTETFEAVLPEAQSAPVITLGSIVLPSSPGAMDGSFTVSFTSLSTAPYDITINGVLAGQSDGSPFLWNNLPPGTYDVFATDNNGCVSNTASVTLTSSTNLRAGWTQAGFMTMQRQTEGQIVDYHSRAGLFVAVDFALPQNNFRLQVQELSYQLNEQPQSAILLSLQQVQPLSAERFSASSEPRDSWQWANGLAVLQGYEQQWFWQSTLSWQPKKLNGLKLVADTYLGKRLHWWVGLRQEW